MPLYDYDCADCGRRFEVIHGVHADGPTACPVCGGGPVRKAITAAAIHYKGSGWAKKERRASTAGTSAKAATDGGGDQGGDTTGTATATTNDDGAERSTGKDAPAAKAGSAAKASTTTSGSRGD